MSPSGDRPSAGHGAERTEALERLEEGVDALLARIGDLERSLTDAENRIEEAEELVRRFTGDEEAAGRLLSRLRSLEEENDLLRSRLDDGRETVERLLARIRFLEEQR